MTQGSLSEAALKQIVNVLARDESAESTSALKELRSFDASLVDAEHERVIRLKMEGQGQAVARAKDSTGKP
jgi:hypothetical protein